MSFTTTSSSATGNVIFRVAPTRFRINPDDFASGPVPRDPGPPTDPFPDAIEVPFRIVDRKESEPVAAIGEPL